MGWSSRRGLDRLIRPGPLSKAVSRCPSVQCGWRAMQASTSCSPAPKGRCEAKQCDATRMHLRERGTNLVRAEENQGMPAPSPTWIPSGCVSRARDSGKYQITFSHLTAKMFASGPRLGPGVEHCPGTGMAGHCRKKGRGNKRPAIRYCQ